MVVAAPAARAGQLGVARWQAAGERDEHVGVSPRPGRRSLVRLVIGCVILVGELRAEPQQLDQGDDGGRDGDDGGGDRTHGRAW